MSWDGFSEFARQSWVIVALAPFAAYVLSYLIQKRAESLRAEDDARLKEQMLGRGFSADEIERVINAGRTPEDDE